MPAKKHRAMCFWFILTCFFGTRDFNLPLTTSANTATCSCWKGSCRWGCLRQQQGEGSFHRFVPLTLSNWEILRVQQFCRCLFPIFYGKQVTHKSFDSAVLPSYLSIHQALSSPDTVSFNQPPNQQTERSERYLKRNQNQLGWIRIKVRSNMFDRNINISLIGRIGSCLTLPNFQGIFHYFWLRLHLFIFCLERLKLHTSAKVVKV